MKTFISIVLTSTAVLSTANTALADATARSMPAVDNALEVTFGTHLSQSDGDLGDNLPAAEDVAGTGVGLEASIGWRVTPNLQLGAYTNLTGASNRDDMDRGAVSLAAGIKADWHFRPASSLDPWVSLGTGMKFLGIESGELDYALTGLELAKVQVGLDFRQSPRFAIAPVIGASATRFNTQYDKDDNAMSIDDREINWTFSAGVIGRFDAFATTR